MKTPAPALLALFCCAACPSQKPAPPPPPPAPGAAKDCSDSAIRTVTDVMDCKMGPFGKNEVSEPDARRWLEKLRDAYPDPTWASADPGTWPMIVQRMLDTRNYAQGCKQCHGEYMKAYRAQYRGTRLP